MALRHALLPCDARAPAARRAAADALFAAQSKEHDRAYYYNHVTNERTWTRPADSNLAWVRFHEEL